MAQRTKFRQRQFQKSSPRHFSREDESKGVEGYCPRNYRPCFDWAKEGQDIPMCIPERYSCEDYDNAESYDQQLAEIIEQRKREISLRGGQQYSWQFRQDREKKKLSAYTSGSILYVEYKDAKDWTEGVTATKRTWQPGKTVPFGEPGENRIASTLGFRTAQGRWRKKPVSRWLRGLRSSSLEW